MLVVRLPRKRKPAAVGYLERVASPLPEDRQGLAVSTLGKVIRRGWDWIGLSSSSPGLVGGLIEAPGLSAALTLNKGDFVRAGRRGITYLALPEGPPGGGAGPAHRVGRGARPGGLGAAAGRASPREGPRGGPAGPRREFPALAALVERRPGGQRRLPTGERAFRRRPAPWRWRAAPCRSLPRASQPQVKSPRRRGAVVREPRLTRTWRRRAGSPPPPPEPPAPPGRCGRNPPGARRPGWAATPDPLRPRDRLRAPARVARSRAARRVHRPRQHRAPRVPARGRLPVRGLPRRAVGGHGARGGRGRARGHAGVPDDLPRAVGRSGRPRPAPPPAPGGRNSPLSGRLTGRRRLALEAVASGTIEMTERYYRLEDGP